MILDLCAVTCTIAFVFMALVVVTDAFGVRKELERIADSLEGGEGWLN
jgi:acid phosphatase family membrane protein YuiD